VKEFPTEGSRAAVPGSKFKVQSSNAAEPLVQGSKFKVQTRQSRWFKVQSSRFKTYKLE